MITLLKTNKPYKPKIGNLMASFYSEKATDYFSNITETPKGEELLLSIINPNPWVALKKIGVNVSPINMTYKCPYTNYEFYCVVPILIFSTDITKYKGKKLFYDEDYLLDYDFHRKMFNSSMHQPSSIQKLLAGSGYTSGTMINDGSASKKFAISEMSNGDKLYLMVWEWYNK